MTASERKEVIEEAQRRMNEASRNGVFECQSLDYYYRQVMKEKGFMK